MLLVLFTSGTRDVKYFVREIQKRHDDVNYARMHDNKSKYSSNFFLQMKHDKKSECFALQSKKLSEYCLYHIMNKNYT